MIGALLGHTQPQTSARYAHLKDDPKKKASARIGNRIASLLDEEDGATLDNVLLMKRGRKRRR